MTISVLSCGKAATNPSCEIIGWITLITELASILRSLTIRVTYWSPCSTAGIWDWVSGAELRTSREGMILITDPARVVVKRLICKTDWKI